MLSLYILLSVFGISLISLIGIFALSFKAEFLQKALFIFVGLAAGAFFGNAFLHLIPESFEAVENAEIISLFVIGGILIFFVLEKFLHWHHHHAGGEEVEEGHALEMVDLPSKKIKPLGFLILISDSIHNFVDGVVIAASFGISVEVGIATTIAIALHEIPQEVADFALLLHSGMSKAKALWFNFASALFAVLGAGVAILASNFISGVNPFIAAFAAGAFIYIAGSDLVPELHKTHSAKKSLIQFISIIVGVLLMFFLGE
ncbi:MAG: ZIP family metal transporter [Patescibacteria group bacterium]